MRNFFDYDGKFFRFLGKIGDLMILNIMFIVCCIPIFTIGAAITSLYSVTLKMAKNEEGYIIQTYFKTFKENFKQSTAMWLIALVIMIISAVDIYICKFMEQGMMPTFTTSFLIVFSIAVNMILLYALTLQCTFENTIKNTIKNGLILAISYLPFSVIVVAVSLSPVLAVLLFTKYIAIELPLILIVWFALAAYINSHIFNYIYKKYMPDKNEEATA